MKAIRVNHCGGPEVLVAQEQPDLTPMRDQILVQIKAAGVNPVDTYLRAGAEGYQPKLPYTPGLDGAGVVLAVGPEQRKFRVGERVYVAGSLTGTYAEQCICTEVQTYALAEGLSFAHGAALGIPYATAYRALFQRGRVEAGENVLIHGASGGVGLAAVQLCHARGLAAVGTAGSQEGRAAIVAQGAVAAFDHHASNYREDLLAWTQGRGFDVIVEMLANVNLGHDLHLLARGGRVVVVGSRGSVEINPRLTMAKDSSVLGFSMMNVSDSDKRELHSALAPLLASGQLQPLIRDEMPLTEAPQAHSQVLQGAALGKLVLIP